MRVITEPTVETTVNEDVLDSLTVAYGGEVPVPLREKLRGKLSAVKSATVTGAHVTKALAVAPVHIAGSKWDRHVSYSTAKKALKEEMIREGKALRS